MSETTDKVVEDAPVASPAVEDSSNDASNVSNDDASNDDASNDDAVAVNKIPFNLTTQFSLDQFSNDLFDKFVNENKNKKEVTTHDVFALMARAAAALVNMRLESGKRLQRAHQVQLLTTLFDMLVADEENDFSADDRLKDIIDTVLNLRDGIFTLDLGKKGWGCIPCLSSVKVSVKE